MSGNATQQSGESRHGPASGTGADAVSDIPRISTIY
jgi:hypothetical protein